MTIRNCALLSAVGFLFACGGAEGQSATELDLGPAEVLVAQCTQGSSLRPSYWARQGQSLEGLTGSSFTVVGARTGCQNTDSLTLDKTALVGSVGGQQVSGNAFVGAALQVRDASGLTSEIAITKIESDATDSTNETQLYTLMGLDNSGQLKNLCNPDPDGRQVAIPLRGHWDATGALIKDDSISFHCTSGVIAKCVRWGYRPWQSKNGKSLVDYHQTCTRMARADYCGDGQTHTQDGTEINMYDAIGLHPLDASLSLFEAAWTPDGAFCVAHDRWLNVLGLLSPLCQGQFQISLLQTNPINPADLCFAKRTSAQASQVLLANRSGLNISL